MTDQTQQDALEAEVEFRLSKKAKREQSTFTDARQAYSGLSSDVSESESNILHRSAGHRPPSPTQESNQ